GITAVIVVPTGITAETLCRLRSSSPVRKVDEEHHGVQVNSQGLSPHVILGNQVLSTKIHHYIGRSSHLQPRQFTIVFSTVRSQLALHQSPLASESVIFRAM